MRSFRHVDVTEPSVVSPSRQTHLVPNSVPKSHKMTSFDMYYEEHMRLMEVLACEWTDELAQQAADCLASMQLEARTSEDADEKHELLERVKVYRQNFQALRLQQESDVLLGGVSSTGKDDATRRLHAQNETLLQARRTVQETEEIGLEINQELARNRDTMQASLQKVEEMKNMTQQAGMILKRLNKWWNR